MKLSKERISSISHLILDRLIQAKAIHLNLGQNELTAALETLITEELQIEDRLNDEVRQVLKAYETEIDKGDLDYRKMFQMTKRQLAKERGIIL